MGERDFELDGVKVKVNDDLFNLEDALEDKMVDGMVNHERYPDGEPPVEMRRKEGESTTFEQCGWCKHAMGSHRYSYCIEGR